MKFYFNLVSKYISYLIVYLIYNLINVLKENIIFFIILLASINTDTKIAGFYSERGKTLGIINYDMLLKHIPME